MKTRFHFMAAVMFLLMFGMPGASALAAENYELKKDYNIITTDHTTNN